MLTLEQLEEVARDQLWPPGYKLFNGTAYALYSLDPFGVCLPGGAFLNTNPDPRFVRDGFATSEEARVAAWKHFDETTQP